VAFADRFAGKERRQAIAQAVDSRTSIPQARPEDLTTKCLCITAGRGMRQCETIVPKPGSRWHRLPRDPDEFLSLMVICTTIRRAWGTVSLLAEAGVGVVVRLEAPLLVQSATVSAMPLRPRHHRGTKTGEGKLVAEPDVGEAHRNADAGVVSRRVVVRRREVDRMHRRVMSRLLRRIYRQDRGICPRHRHISRV
jgi:hypothetical protein